MSSKKSGKSRSYRTTPSRLGTFHPVLDRLVFILALLGIIVVVHLGIQESRGFDQGCWGFNPPVQGSAPVFDCEAVVSSAAGKVMGVSNVAFGLIFYLAVALISARVPFVKAVQLSRLKRVRALFIAIAFAYALYLIYYQHFVIGEYCALCITSAIIVSILFVSTVMDYFGSSARQSRSSSNGAPALAYRSARLFVVLPLLAVVLVGADLVYFSLLEKPVLAAALPSSVPGAGPNECYYDPEVTLYPNYASLINERTPMKGNAESKVTVIEFFDPNCPHCKTLSPIMHRLTTQYGDKVGFYYKPYPIWEISLAQVEALYAAAEAGKFFDMMDSQFILQRAGGLSKDDLKTIADEIGLGGTQLLEQIASGRHRATVLQDRRQMQQAGVNRFPRVWINGRTVAIRSEACLSQLIGQAIAEN